MKLKLLGELPFLSQFLSLVLVLVLVFLQACTGSSKGGPSNNRNVPASNQSAQVSIKVNSLLVSTSGMTESILGVQNVSAGDLGNQQTAVSGYQIGKSNYNLETQVFKIVLGCRKPFSGTTVENVVCDGIALNKVQIRFVRDPGAELSESAVLQLLENSTSAPVVPILTFESGKVEVTAPIPFDGTDIRLVAIFKIDTGSVTLTEFARIGIHIVDSVVSGVDQLLALKSELKFSVNGNLELVNDLGFGSSSYKVAKIITVKNDSPKPIKLGLVRLLGPAFGFAGTAFPGFGGTCKESASLAEGAECTLHLEFAPAFGGDFAGVLILSASLDENKKYAVLRLSGKGAIGMGSKQVVFTTSKKFNGNLGGFSGADRICQDAASSAKLPGRWVSLSGEASQAAVQDTISASAIHLIQGKNIENVLGQSILGDGDQFVLPNASSARVNYSELGEELSDSSAWSIGLRQLGGPGSSVRLCRQFTVGTSSVSDGSIGDGVSLDGRRWAGSSAGEACSQNHRVFCISVLESASVVQVQENLIARRQPGEINLKILMPLDTSPYGQMEIYRRQGNTAPVGCYLDYFDNSSSKVYAVQISESNSGQELNVVDSTGSANTAFSYLVCLKGKSRSPFTDYSSSATLSQVSSATGEISYEHTLFATQGLYSGNLGGVSGGNSICALEAQNRGLLGNWKAILSTSAQSVDERILISGPVKTTTGEFLAGNAFQFWNGYHSAQIPLADGTFPAILQVRTVLTGTISNGKFAVSVGSCRDWTDGGHGVGGAISLMLPQITGKWRFGHSYFPIWNGQLSGHCDNYQSDIPGGYRLYCISQRPN